MKTFGKNILVFLLLSLVSACVKDDMMEKEPSVAIEARMEVEEKTKTTLSDQIDGMYYSLWSAGDEISVYVDGDEHPSKFTLKSGEGSTISLFEGSRKGNEYVAVARGINTAGELIVTREDGQEEHIYAGEVSVRGVYGYI